MQSLMRHANSNITMDIYTHALSSKKRQAQSKAVGMNRGSKKRRNRRESPSVYFLCIAPIFQKSPNPFGRNGEDDETRPRDLCRDRVAVRRN